MKIVFITFVMLALGNTLWADVNGKDKKVKSWKSLP